MTEEIKNVSYCVGLSVAESLIHQDLEHIDPKALAEGITDVFEKKQPKFSAEQANALIQQYIQRISEEKFEVYKKDGEEFLLKNKEKHNIHATPSGLQYEILQEGNGNKPTENSTVEVHYHGTLIDGTIFDSSVQRGQTATFGVTQVIKGWTEALQLMSEGAKYRLFIPQELAYGAHPHPGGAIKPYMALIFDVELIKIH